MNFTGSNDANRVILSKLDDRNLLTICRVNTYFRNLCNEDFYRNRLISKYPDAAKYKPAELTWKKYYLNVVYYVNKIWEENGFQYKTGNPKIYYDAFYNTRYSYERIGLAAENNYKDLLTFLKPLYHETTYYTYLIEPAAKGGHMDLINEALEQRENSYLDLGINGAAEAGNKDLVDFFLNKGGKITSYSLKKASFSGNLEMIKYLMSLKKFPPNDLNYALQTAAEKNHMDIVKYLIAQGANNYKMGLYGAIKQENEDMVQFFLTKLRESKIMIDKNFLQEIIFVADSAGQKKWAKYFHEYMKRLFV